MEITTKPLLSFHNKCDIAVRNYLLHENADVRPSSELFPPGVRYGPFFSTNIFPYILREK